MLFSLFFRPNRLVRIKPKTGFSLLELLVVISIIGILIAISSVAFSTVQQKARDAKRQGDLKSIQNAFETYYAQNNTYAAGCDNMDGALPGLIPSDPKTHIGYSTTCTSTTTGYCICALLETGGGNATSYDASCSTLGQTAASNTYYCLKNLQ